MPPTMNGAAAGHDATVRATAPSVAATATIARPTACGVTVWSRSRRSTHWPAAYAFRAVRSAAVIGVPPGGRAQYRPSGRPGRWRPAGSAERVRTTPSRPRRGGRGRSRSQPSRRPREQPLDGPRRPGGRGDGRGRGGDQLLEHRLGEGRHGGPLEAEVELVVPVERQVVEVAAADEEPLVEAVDLRVGHPGVADDGHAGLEKLGKGGAECRDRQRRPWLLRDDDPDAHPAPG